MYPLAPAHEKPDRFVLLDTDYGTLILSAWQGGYMNGDSWRLSTPIRTAESIGDRWTVGTKSGSVYTLRLGSYGMTPYSADIFAARKEQMDPSQKFDVVSEEDAELLLKILGGTKL